ncbi:MAG: cupin [Nitrospinae bacterium RIFCSPLOWO2_12_39_16]|nr:MAG: cupin [Nitrospinae bacterium RIFCSPLOWO2_02_39_17]OGW13269.1 MAG: cupin [Nitrospinae bacterium RIFCSPLOWO2_12_39_16]
MKKIWLGFCFAVLLSSQLWALDEHGIKSETLAKSISSWNGSILPEYKKGQPEVTILRITIPPKAKLPLHTHPVINAGILIKGELTVLTEKNETLHLKAGDSIVEVVNQLHYGQNEGNEPAEIIAFYAGIQDQPITNR